MLCIPSKDAQLEITGYDFDAISKNDYMCSNVISLNSIETGKLITIPLYKERLTQEARSKKKSKKETKTQCGSIDLVIHIEEFHH